MMGKSKSAWVRANWWTLVGLPSPDADAWVWGDVPLPKSTLHQISGSGSGWLIKKAGSVRREGTHNMFRQNTWTVDRQIYDAVLEHESVDESLMRGCAADPSADAFVIDVYPTRRSAGAMRAVHETVDPTVQVVAITERDVDSYPGRVVVVDDVAETLQYVPDVDVIVVNTLLPRAEIAPDALDAFGGDTSLVVNALGHGAVVDAVETSTGEYSEDRVEDTVGRRESRDDDQASLMEWNPGVMTPAGVDIDSSGQQSLSEYS